MAGFKAPSRGARDVTVHEIALLPGDGIGPKVVDATVGLLDRLGDAHGFRLETTRHGWGAGRYLETGEVMPPDAVDRLRGADAILQGAFGLPDAPNGVISKQGHHAIRNAFDQYVNLRPAHLYAGGVSPLSGYEAGDIDVAWYRENTEGEYLEAGGRLERAERTELAVSEAVYTRTGVERIARAAFEAAGEREGHVTSVTKSNAIPHGLGFWDEIVAEVAADFPAVTFEVAFADAANLTLVERPETLDVVVSPNLFGDVLSEAAAAVTGGLGLAPSGNINPGNDAPDTFEPVHGTAPDIAGEGIANPLATVLSGAMLLENVGEPAAAGALRDAVAAHLRDGDAPRTPDLGGTAGTDAIVEDVARRL